mmetsp:Transcript_48536/g.95190  ORF Transcript_48536/g.95190 Transcript_48536/m.95190 type:complete len:346 (+) Transcript_48536:182-1219(+)
MQGKQEEAVAVFTRGVELGLFSSPYKRFLRKPAVQVASRPFWNRGDPGFPTAIVDYLENNFAALRQEALQLLRKGGTSEDPSGDGSGADGQGFFRDPESLHDRGYWDVWQIVQNGRFNNQNRAAAPQMFKAMEQFPALTTCMEYECDAYLSRLKPGTHIEPHCGPTNLRLRLHLALVIPCTSTSTAASGLKTCSDGSSSSSSPEGQCSEELAAKDTSQCSSGESPCCRIRVANETRAWQEGKVLVFDDAFEHEVWHEGWSGKDPGSETGGDRLILNVDIWNPDAPTEAVAELLAQSQTLPKTEIDRLLSGAGVDVSAKDGEKTQTGQQATVAFPVLEALLRHTRQ